jgi:hypothetical protein
MASWEVSMVDGKKLTGSIRIDVKRRFFIAIANSMTRQIRDTPRPSS